ncbi:uncharacterized protein V6R79_012860 [Siganus canaliculatus]
MWRIRSTAQTQTRPPNHTLRQWKTEEAEMLWHDSGPLEQIPPLIPQTSTRDGSVTEHQGEPTERQRLLDKSCSAAPRRQEDLKDLEVWRIWRHPSQSLQDVASAFKRE